MAKMREMPVEDLFTSGAHIREDGRLMRDVYYAEVKKPSAMSGSTDLITLVKKMPGSEAFIPASESDCKLLKK
jgi:branched-chain amino acid transport system substrate-binding protein